MAKPTERQKVQNPFTMGPSTTEPTNMPARLMRDSTALPRSAFQVDKSGTAIVNSLVSFAGAGADLYTKKLSKDIKADKIIQTSRAIQGLTPTDDTTVAGYKAHAAVKIGQYAEQFQAEMVEASKKDIPEEEWEEMIRTGYANIDKNLSSEYKTYKEDIDLQELAAITLREKMLTISSKREINKMKIEENKRFNTFSDTITAAITQEGKDTDKRVQEISEISTALKLTPAQTDDAVAVSIVQANSLEAIELAKTFKGVGRKTTLFERNQTIQKLERKLLQEKSEEEAYDTIALRREKEQDFIMGGDTKAFLEYAKTDKNLSTARVNSLWDKRDNYAYEQTRLAKVSEAVSDPIKSVDPSTTDKEIQSALMANLKSNVSVGLKKAGIEEMPEGPEKVKAMATVQAKAIREAANNAIAEGTVLKSYVKDFNMVVTTDIATMTKAFTEKGEALKFERTPKVFQEAVTAFQNMSPMAQQEHLKAMDNNNADIMRQAMDLIDSGIPKVEAFRKAQVDSRVPKSYKTKAVKEAVDKVIDEIGDGLFVPDVKSSQEAYVNETVRGEISRSQTPDTDSNIERVAKAFKGNHVQSEGIFYKGTSKELQRLTKLHPDKLTDTFEMVKLKPAIAEKLEAASEVYGFDVDDCFAVTDVETGTFSFRSPDGSYLSEAFKLSSLKGLYDEQRVESMKKTEEVKNRMKESLERHGALMDNILHGEPIPERLKNIKKGKDPKELIGHESTLAWVKSAINNVKEGLSDWWVSAAERDEMQREREGKKGSKIESSESEDKYLNQDTGRVGISLK